MSFSARAGTFTSEAGFGSGTVTGEFGYSGEISGEDPEKSSPWGYDFSYSLSASGVGSTLRGAKSATQTDHTHTVSASVNYDAFISPGFKASYSLTPEEFLSVAEAGVFLEHRFGARKEDEETGSEENQEDEFTRFFDVSVSGDVSRYAQRFSRGGGAGRKARPSTGSLSALQTEAGLFMKAGILRWLELQASGYRYFYDRDPGAFLAQLDQQRAVATRAEDFLSTLSGFPRDRYGLGAVFRVAEVNTIETEASVSHTVVTGAATHGWNAGFKRDFGRVEAGASYSESRSGTDLQALYGLSLNIRL